MNTHFSHAYQQRSDISKWGCLNTFGKGGNYFANTISWR